MTNTPDYRWDAALAAAMVIIDETGMPETPQLVSLLTYTILEAVYEAERSRPKPAFSLN